MKENHDKKDNTSLIVIFIVVLLAVIGVIGYMLFNNSDNNDTNTTTEDIKEEATTITMDDVAGSYLGTFTAEENNDNDDTDENDSLVEDAKDAADNIADSVTGGDKSYQIELELNNDGTARLVNTNESKEIISGTYTIANKMITFVADVSEENTTVKTTSYMFTVNDDESLTYNHIGKNFKLEKVSSDNLEYIK